jgi:hypothetical protein
MILDPVRLDPKESSLADVQRYRDAVDAGGLERPQQSGVK